MEPLIERARAVHALMSGLIDYAGLFPPAGRSMAEAVGAYAKHVSGPEAWMLGRFVVPVQRLGEFEAAAGPVLGRGDEDEPWLISALAGDDLGRELDAVCRFNDRHTRARNGLAIIDAVEIKVPVVAGAGPSAAFIDRTMEILPEGVYPFFELPVLSAGAESPPDLRGCIAALAGADGAAKVRTGGVTPESIPTARAVAEFLVTCAAGDVPFKATAGLHHAIRAEHPLTYESGCPRAVMHGFLNVFVGAGLVLNHRFGGAEAAEVLSETESDAFKFEEGAVSWRGHRLDAAQVARTRELFALSYGSCSFEEPVAELRAMGLI